MPFTETLELFELYNNPKMWNDETTRSNISGLIHKLKSSECKLTLGEYHILGELGKGIIAAIENSFKSNDDKETKEILVAKTESMIGFLSFYSPISEAEINANIYVM